MRRFPRHRRDVLKVAVFSASLVPLALIVWGVSNDTLSANPIKDIQLQTGRWAMRFLAAALAVTPLRRITGLNELIRYRRMLGLFAFFYATLHLVNYVAIDKFFDWNDIVEDVAKHLYVTVGAATWLLLIPLALTSTRASIRRLGGRTWNLLHRLVYLAAITATVHYLWAVKKDTFVPVIYFVIFATLLGYRAWFWLAARRRRAMATDMAVARS